MNDLTVERGRISRGEETRRKLLRAAVDSLGGNGFASTTVDVLMQATGVSRGSVLHQFPTRLDLIVASAEFAMAGMLDETIARIREIEPPARKLEMLAEVVWEVHRSVSATALTEVLLASRWDRDLALRLIPLVEQVETQIDALVGQLADAAGVTERHAVLAWGRLLIAGMRGLVVEFMLRPDREMVIAALDLLKRQYRTQARLWLDQV